MAKYIVRRTLVAIPMLFVMSLALFALLDLAPGDPTSQLPLTVPAEIREQIRESLGFNDPFLVRWWSWTKLMVINEPIHLFESLTDTCIGDCENRDRIISWSSRSPAMDTVYERLPQTLWVLGLGLLFGLFVAVPIGTLQAYRQYSWFDNVGSVVTILGFSLPIFVIGPLLIWVFSIKLGWLPTFYNTTHDVELTSWSSIWFQIKQLIMPVGILTLFYAANFAKFVRSSVLENLNEGYVRTARSKGLDENTVLRGHVLRNSLIPVATLLALLIPSVFGGAILTESIFRINGLGQLLLVSLRQNDIPLVQALLFIFAFLTILFNIIADVLYGFLDPRIRYD